MAIVLTLACDFSGGPVGAPYSPAQPAVELTHREVSIDVGDTVRVGARSRSVRESSARRQIVHWTVSDPSVALVDEGLIIPLRRGRTQVVASTDAGSASVNVEVFGSVSLTELSVCDAPILLPRGESRPISALLTFSNGFTLNVRSSVTWLTTDASVADVAGPTIAGVSAGRTKLIAALGEHTDTVDIAVLATPALRLDPDSLTLTIGDRVALRATDLGGEVIADPGTVLWASGSSAVAVVDDTGGVIAMGPGTTTITAVSGAEHGTARLSIVPATPPVGRVVITPDHARLEQLGDSVHLAATAYDLEGRAIAAPALAWAGNDSTVITVTRSGLVRRVGHGMAYVIVALGGRADSARIDATSHPPSPTTAPFAATITLDVDSPGRPVNRRTLGSNIEWVYGGNQMLSPGTTQFDPVMLELARNLRPTVLRYPGGSQGDFYHWQDGMGPLVERGWNENFFSRERQRVDFGTAEFLTLSRHVGAEPLITVNAMTGTAEEAAAWVHATNVARVRAPDGSALDPVRFWEIDNEPYLMPDGRPELHMVPEEYARRANSFIRAMRAVDPSIVIGIPMRSDTLGISPLAPMTMGFARKVLSQVTERIDFVALHNAYFPFLYDQGAGFDDDEVFQATMAASKVVEDDLANVRALLRRYRPGQSIGIAITEYNAMFSFEGPRAGYIATLGGALYVADVLRVFAEADDVLMANFWSLADNWYFGAFSRQQPLSARPQPRPAYHVLHAYDQVLRGRLIPARVRSPSFSTRQIGFVPATGGLPLVTALATKEGDRVRLLVLNKDPRRPARLTVQAGGQQIEAVQMQELADLQIFDVERAREAVRWKTLVPPGGSTPPVVELAPRSLVWIEIQLRR